MMQVFRINLNKGVCDGSPQVAFKMLIPLQFGQRFAHNSCKLSNLGPVFFNFVQDVWIFFNGFVQQNGTGIFNSNPIDWSFQFPSFIKVKFKMSKVLWVAVSLDNWYLHCKEEFYRQSYFLKFRDYCRGGQSATFQRFSAASGLLESSTSHYH